MSVLCGAELLQPVDFALNSRPLPFPSQPFQRAGASADKVFLTVQKYGNMSSATAPVALVDAVEEGRVAPNSLVLMPAFGGGLTLSAHLIRWGERLTPLQPCDAELPPTTKTALDIVNEIRAQKKLGEAEASRFKTLGFAENRAD